MPRPANEGFQFAAGAEPAPPAGGSRARPSAGRHALGLPGGSVRALLTFMVLGLVWTLMYLQKEIPLYLQYLMFMILGHYYGARHETSSEVREPSPLYLPRGAIRTLIFLGFIAIVGAVVYQHRDDMSKLIDQIINNEDTRRQLMPLMMVAGFYLGLTGTKLGRLFGSREGPPGWYQDIQAWLSLLAVVGLAAEVIILLIINPSLAEENKNVIVLPAVESILAAIVGFYFGARS